MPDNDDPFLPSDRTLRPRPGAGRRGMPEPAMPRTATAGFREFESIPDVVRSFLGLGLNPLVQSATPLLLLTGELRHASSVDVSGLRRHVLEEIRHFEERARAAGVRSEIVLAARYALCAGLDEAVLSTPWGAQSEWAQHPVLVALHREAWGGEKFFEMLDRIRVDPARHIDLMELQYLILALGFTGKYHMLDRGRDHLAVLQRDLLRTIRTHRGSAAAELSLQWRGLEDRRNRLVRYVPWWVVAAAAVAVLAVTFVVYQSRLATQASPLHAELVKVGREYRASPAPARPIEGPTLKLLLEEREETASALEIVEDGARTVVILGAGDLFESGSAKVNPKYQRTLEGVAAELNKLPGSVTVVGHTDDQKIKSWRFPNNYDLSRERAENVAAILKQKLEEPARVTTLGVGESEPRRRPESEPQNRALNRRVEIIHLREG